MFTNGTSKFGYLIHFAEQILDADFVFNWNGTDYSATPLPPQEHTALKSLGEIIKCSKVSSIVVLFFKLQTQTEFFWSSSAGSQQQRM